MSLPKKVEGYPEEFFTIVESLMSGGEPIVIPCESTAKARKLRSVFYGFKTTLIKEAQTIAEGWISREKHKLALPEYDKQRVKLYLETGRASQRVECVIEGNNLVMRHRKDSEFSQLLSKGLSQSGIVASNDLPSKIPSSPTKAPTKPEDMELSPELQALLEQPELTHINGGVEPKKYY